MLQPVKTALSNIGDQHTYQKILVALLFLTVVQVNYLMIGPTFIFMNPVFDCDFASGLVDESQACDHLQRCKVSNSFTIVAKLQLYCDRQTERNIIQSIVPIGAIFGLFCVNYVSDTVGRKVAFIFVQTVGLVGMGLTLLGGQLSEVWILVVAQFVCGFSGFAMLTMAYFLPSQFCQEQFRQRTVISVNYSWSFASVILGILFYKYNQWNNFLLLIAIIPGCAILLISCFYVVEGPYFLYGKKREKECLQSLRFIALVNGKMEQFEKVAADFKLQFKEQKKEELPSLLSILKNKLYLKMAIILTLADTGSNVYYFGTNYALDDIGYDYGANMIASGLIQLAAFILLSFTITKVPRKKGLILFNAIIIVLGMLFFINPIKNDKVASFITLGVIRFFFMLAFTIVLMLLTETFPPNVQATIAGIIEGVAQVGSFLGPIVITFCINLRVYPIIVLSFIALIMIILPLLFMRESAIQTDSLLQKLIQKNQINGAQNIE